MRNDAERRSASEHDSESGQAASSKPGRKTLEQHFNDFWAAYPRRKGRGDAKSAWDRARKRASIEDILAGAQALASSGGDPSYIPYPATWLNRDGWLDEPDPETRSGYTANGEVDVNAILGRDLWQLPSPPEGIEPGTRAYIEWAREETALHYAERLEQAKERIARREGA